LFSDDRKKPIPEFPWRVGIITSETGAALRDMLKVIKRRNSKVSILVHPVAVQGEGAGKEIVDAIHNMNEYQGIDVLIIGRGGGSVEDLWAFNEEIVARAITVSKIPIVSAVGHEVDYTISDFVADKRASTPSVAAELVVPILLDEAFKEIFGLSKQLLISMKSKVSTRRDRLRLLMNRKFFLKPEYIYLTREQKRDDLERRLELAYEKCKMIHDKRRQKIIAIVVISIIFVAYLLWKLIA
jgi:exodeoxyribonuclease VII large subunit